MIDKCILLPIFKLCNILDAVLHCWQVVATIFLYMLLEMCVVWSA